MGSADERLAAALRQGEDPARILRDALATGRLAPGYTTARNARCKHCSPSVTPAERLGAIGAGQAGCPECCGAGYVGGDPLDLVALLALCGPDDLALAARDLLDVRREAMVRFSPRMDGQPPLGGWIARVSGFAAKLPPKRVGVADCHACAGRGWITFLGDDSEPCPSCHGAPEITFHDTPAERWLLTVAALAVAEECHLRGAFDVEALTRIRAWVAEPTPANWENLFHDVGARFLASYGLHDGRSLLASADVLGPDRVREVASAAILAAPLLEVER